MKIPIFEHHEVFPFASLGLTHGFFKVHGDTLIFTWMAMAVLFLISLIGGRLLKHKPDSTFTFALEQVIDFFSSLCIESFGSFRHDYFAFVSSLFFFTLGCNLIGILPFVEESSRDLNTTLAIALASFVYVQREQIKIGGAWSYVKSFFQPIFILFPLNIVDKMAKIISMAFRLFGNILGGSIVFFLLIHVIAGYRIYFMVGSAITLIGYLVLEQLTDKRSFSWLRTIFYYGWITLYCLAGTQMFFGIFEGAIQAFVVAMLTITYLSVTLNESEKTNEEALR